MVFDIDKQPRTNKKSFRRKLFANLKRNPVTYMVLAVMIFGLVAPTLATADTYDEQINELREQNQQKENQQTELLNEAESFEDKLAGLRTQIRMLQDQIEKDQVKMRDLEEQIALREKELKIQQDLLGQNIRKMYTEGEISTLEMLASSKNLSEFVDKEQYRNSLNGRIKIILDEINVIKKQLSESRDLLAKTIEDTKKRQTTVDEQRTEVSRLLAMNKAQRNELDRQIAGNNSKISDLRSEQARANAALFGGGTLNVPDTSGYPWANFSPFPNSVSDPWGMYLRQCVSYTAWKVWRSGRHMPFWGGRGNAKQWDDNARAAGIPVNNTPKRGAVGVSNAGYYGHVVYVEQVYGDGNILISQYNASWDGRYSEAVVHQSKFVYIHF